MIGITSMDEKPKLKSGKEITDDFFAEIENFEGVDAQIANALKDLYETNKLTEKSITNLLSNLRTDS